MADTKVMERHALIFSDGSMSVPAEGRSMADIEDERRDADRNQTDPEHMTKIALVRVEIVEVLFSPSQPELPQLGELERLRAENADLRRRLGVRGAANG